MDFSYLMELAKENKKTSHERKKPGFSTAVSAPKKLQKKEPNKAAIQALLDQQKKEEKVKLAEFKKTKENLLLLRSKDRLAHKRVNAMINRTKGASKSVMEDAKDISTARGEKQCDEDDYGYESAMSQAIFEKLVTKYSTMPDDKDMFKRKTVKSNLSDIKSRVINTLKKQEEEDLGIRKRQRRSRYSEDSSEAVVSVESDAADPPDVAITAYEDNIESRKTSSAKKKEGRREKIKVDKANNIINAVKPKNSKFDHFKYKKKSEIKELKKRPNQITSFADLMKKARDNKDVRVTTSDIFPIVKKEPLPKRLLTAKEKKVLEEQRMYRLNKTSKPSATHSSSSLKTSEPTLQKQCSKVTQKSKSVLKNTFDKKMPQTLPVKEKKIVSPKSIPPKTKNEIKKGTRVESEPEEEYEDDEDSEFDDFIVDDDDDAHHYDKLNYSKEIEKLYGYNKRMYKDLDDEIDNMEASYADVEREEKFSAKIGLMEDLEDIRKEEEQKMLKRKLKAKKV